MASLTNSERSALLAAISRHLDAPRPLTARLDRGAGIGTTVLGCIPGIIAGVILYNTAGELRGPLPLIVLGLGLWSFASIASGMWYVCDRSPRLVLDEAGLTDYTPGLKRVIPWDAVSRATLHRTTRNGSEQSATLTLYINSRVMRDSEIALDVTYLDHGSDEILAAVGKWARLS